MKNNIFILTFIFININFMLKNTAVKERLISGESPAHIINSESYLNLLNIFKEDLDCSFASLLLNRGLDINFKDKNGLTMLMFATIAENKNLIKFLINLKADPNIQNKNGRTALIMAAEKIFSHDILKILLSTKNINVNLQDQDLNNAFMKFIEFDNNIEILNLFIKNNINLEAQNKLGDTAVIVAAKNHNSKVIKFLKKHKANLNHRNRHGKTALINVIYNSCEINKTIKNLVKAKVDLDLQDENGNTALIIATYKNNLDVVDFLIKNNAKINLRNNFDRTAIFYAILEQNKDIVSLLLSQFANLNLRDLYGNTPLDLANNSSNYYYYEIANMVQEAKIIQERILLNQIRN